MTATSTPTDLESYLEGGRERRLASYMDFLRLASISALPQHSADCRRTAEWLADELRALGAEHVEVSETEAHPIVYADWLHADGAPTAIVYGHYDVQPVDPLDLWESPPFEPVVKGERMLARGAADDKAQIHMHLRAAEALLATRGRLPLNLKFVLEGDEEASSPGLDRWLEEHREQLAADVAVISDTEFFDGNLPAITIALRGIMYAQIDVAGPPVDMHSGGYGGVIQNPANALAWILAALKSPDGVVQLPGFYDDVVPLTEPEKAALKELPLDEEEYRQTLGVPALAGEPGYSVLERRGARPTLDVNGMWSGFQGEGSKTIIPARAHAKVSCRLVPGQQPRKVFELLKAHVERVTAPGVKVEVRNLGNGDPSLTPIDHPATQAAARALEATFGRAPVYIREGGSIPICASFENLLGLPVVLLGFVQPDCGAHAPNEWMDLRNYETGIRTIARYWDELAAALA